MTTEYWHSSGATQSHKWLYDATAGTSSIAADMTYTLGYRVPQGNGLTVGAYAEGGWEKYWWIFPIGWVWQPSPNIGVSYHP